MMFLGQAIHKTQGAVTTRSGQSGGLSVSKMRRHRGRHETHPQSCVAGGADIENVLLTQHLAVPVRQCCSHLVSSACPQKLVRVAWLVVSSSLAAC